MSARLLNSCRTEKGKLQIEIAKTKLRDLWNLELHLLARNRQYKKLLREREISQAYPAGCIDVNTDYLGHITLCLLEHYPSWKEYALESHRGSVVVLASLGSWQAKKWLGDKAELRAVSNDEIARRFFFGNVEIMKALDEGYK
jgi:hypothetical protein